MGGTYDISGQLAEVLPTLQPLADRGIARQPLAKYCLVVYPPRNAMGPATAAEQETVREKISTLPAGTPLDLYVHVPFCSRACTFCNFYFAPGLPAFWQQAESYIGRAVQEIELLGRMLDGKANIQSVYFGGGSPSLLQPVQVKNILDQIRAEIGTLGDVEVSLELHPEIMRLQDGHYLEDLRTAGINRISIGFQSANEQILRATHRGHRASEAQHLLEQARQMGFVRNVDVMWGFVGQTLDDHQRTLERVIAAQPDVITTYFLEIRPTSPEYQDYLKLVGDQEYLWHVVEMGLLNRTVLSAAGYDERTADYWFKDGDFQHRKRKWGGDDSVLLTVGPGTYNWAFHGEDRNVVFFKPYDTEAWAAIVEQGKYPIDRVAILDAGETARRHAMFALRQGSVMKEKITKVAALGEIVSALETFGLMREKEDVWELTLAGRLLNHEITALFSSNDLLQQALGNLEPEELRYASAVHPEFVQRFREVVRRTVSGTSHSSSRIHQNTI